MIAPFVSFADPDDPTGRAVLQEQFRALRKQIPVMYGLLLVNSVFLGFFTYSTAPLAYSIGVPSLLATAVVVRAGIWFRRRYLMPDPHQIRRQLQVTLISGGILAMLFGGWGQLLFTDANAIERACIGLFIFINCISVCYCLQSLPWAGEFVLVCGGLPMAVRLFTADDLLLFGMGLNVLFICGVIFKILRTNYEAFAGIISSRTEVIAERERARDAEERAQTLAYHDPLTGLANRNALRERLEKLAVGLSDLAALLIIDLDRFKPVNDVHGHIAGDMLLREAASRICSLADGAQTFRLGGDEFAVLLDLSRQDIDVPRRLAQQLVLGMSEPFRVGDLVHHIGVSVGISIFPYDARDPETLMRRADIALYRAKDAGRHQYRSFEPVMDAEITRRSLIESELRQALLNDVLRPVYQPLVELSTGRTTGFELLRELGCAEGQGYYLGRPMSGEQVSAVLNRGLPWQWNTDQAPPLPPPVRLAG